MTNVCILWFDTLSCVSCGSSQWLCMLLGSRNGLEKKKIACGLKQIMTVIGKEYVMPSSWKILGQVCRGGGKLILSLGVSLQRCRRANF